jgi:hypothetical protein
MFTADHFGQTPDAGFFRGVNTQSARGQFQVSLALILVLALAAVAIGALARFDQWAAPDSSSANIGGAHVAASALDIGS